MALENDPFRDELLDFQSVMAELFFLRLEIGQQLIHC